MGATMSTSDTTPSLKEQADKVRKLAEDINPSEDITPDSEAEATTALLDDDALGGTISQDDVK